MEKYSHLPLLGAGIGTNERSEYDAPFSLWKANSDIKLVSIIEKGDPSEASTIYNPFDGVNKLSYDGYIYHFNRNKKILDGETSRTYYFRCAYRSCGCTLIVVVDPIGCNYTITKNDKKHESPKCRRTSTLLTTQSVSRAITECRSFAIELARKNPNMKPKTLIALVLREIDLYNNENPEMLMPFVKTEKIREWLRIPQPMSSKEMESLFIPDDIRFRGGQWVLADLTKKTRIILLASIKMSNISNAITRLLLDGTFDIAPPNFKQILNGVGFSMETQSFVPLFHIIIEDKETVTYFDALKLLFDSIAFRSLKAINFDFEPALILAIQSFFKGTSIHMHGCYFHFCQALERKFEEFYGKQQFRDYLHSYMLLPFIKDEDYYTFLNYMNGIDCISAFYRYFCA